MNLINRRFVAFYYDVAPPGRNAGDAWAHDEKAAKAVGPMWDDRERPRRAGGGQSVEGKVKADSYPAAVFLTAKGEKLDTTLWGIVPPERMLAELKRVIAAHPDQFVPSAEEKAVLAAAEADPNDAAAALAAVRLHFELADFAPCRTAAAAALEKTGATPAQRAEILYLAARSALCLRDSEAAAKDLEAALPLAKEAALALVDDLRVAQGHVEMQKREYAAALALFRAVIDEAPKSDRAGEARYYSGLALWRLGKKDEAKDVWRAHRRELPMDRLARRSAASLGVPEAQAFLSQELIETKGWWH
jgi:tetratricopeptide (TPR) repeat protein